MGDIHAASARRSAGRVVAGWIVAVLAAACAVLYVLGTWNPWNLVVLWRWFGNPMRGAVLFFALALTASWLLAPVRSEAGQARRTRWRITLAIGLVAALIGLGLFGGLFTTDHQVLVRSGDRAAVLYNPGTDYQRLHVWVGDGLAARDVGDVGRPCGATSATFTAGSRLSVSTAYGAYDLRLDPAGGKPFDRLPATCAG